MRKFWHVIVFEYTRRVFRWRFLFSLLALHMFLVLVGLLMFLAYLPEFNFSPVGYLDPAGQLGRAAPSSNAFDSRLIPLIFYDTEKEARQALDENKIQAYLVLDENYLQTGQARLVSLKVPGLYLQSFLTQYVRSRLLDKEPYQVIQRVTTQAEIIIRSPDGSQELARKDVFGLFIPVAAAFILIMGIYNISGDLMSVIIQEKSNRTMEILITTAAPWQFIGGKTIALTAVGLSQIMAWAAPLGILYLLRSKALGNLAGTHFPSTSLMLVLATILPSMLIIACLMVTVAVIVADDRQAQLWTFVILAPVYIPLGFTRLILNSPDSPLAIALSYFPLTASVTLGLRSAVGTIPTDQAFWIVLSLIAAALACLGLASYSWRLGMLMYGRSLNWRDFLGKFKKQVSSP
ncbi:MAG: ABC transporter permease [Anaerolineales bacterium]|nr:ABC transporter permease [Anaerolineales bacterium]